MCLYEVIPRSRITEFAHLSRHAIHKVLTLVSPDACCKFAAEKRIRRYNKIAATKEVSVTLLVAEGQGKPHGMRLDNADVE